MTTVAVRHLRNLIDGWPPVHGALQWTFTLFALKPVWEVAALPLYSLGTDARWSQIALVLHCTVGHAGMAFGGHNAAPSAVMPPAGELR